MKYNLRELGPFASIWKTNSLCQRLTMNSDDKNDLYKIESKMFAPDKLSHNRKNFQGALSVHTFSYLRIHLLNISTNNEFYYLIPRPSIEL